jgi:hypothetical protein
LIRPPLVRERAGDAAAVAAAGMTPLENRVALAGNPDVAGAAALLHQNVGGPAY